MSYSCSVCLKTFASKFNLDRHLGSKLLKCGAKIQASSTSVIQPIPTIPRIDVIPPKVDHQLDSLPQTPIGHVDDIGVNKEKINEELYKCINCNKVYKYRQGLFKHKLQCIQAKPIAETKSKPLIPVAPVSQVTPTTIIQNTYISSVYNIQKVNSDNTSTANTVNNTANTTNIINNIVNFNIRNNVLYDGDKPLCVIRNPIEHECVDIIPKEVFISLLALRKYKECPNLTDYIMQNIISKIYEDTSNKSFYKPNLNKTIVLTSTNYFKRTSVAEKELIEKIKLNVEKILCKLYFKHLDSMDLDTQIQCHKNIIHISREIERSSKKFNHYISNIISNNSMFDRESIIQYFNLIDANNLNDIITKYFNESCKFQNMVHALPIKNSIGEIFKETPETTKSILDVMKTAHTQYTHENLPVRFQNINLEEEDLKDKEHLTFMKRANQLFNTPKYIDDGAREDENDHKDDTEDDTEDYDDIEDDDY